jgi:hypothetical protein
MLETAASDASATNVTEPPIAIPNILPINNVRLKDHLVMEGVDSDGARRGNREHGKFSPTFYPRYRTQNSIAWRRRTTLNWLPVTAAAR